MLLFLGMAVLYVGLIQVWIDVDLASHYGLLCNMTYKCFEIISQGPSLFFCIGSGIVSVFVVFIQNMLSISSLLMSILNLNVSSKQLVTHHPSKYNGRKKRLFYSHVHISFLFKYLPFDMLFPALFGLRVEQTYVKIKTMSFYLQNALFFYMEQHIIQQCVQIKVHQVDSIRDFFFVPFNLYFGCVPSYCFFYCIFIVTTVPQLFMTLHVFFRFKSGIIGFKVYLDFNYISLL